MIGEWAVDICVEPRTFEQWQRGELSSWDLITRQALKKIMGVIKEKPTSKVEIKIQVQDASPETERELRCCRLKEKFDKAYKSTTEALGEGFEKILKK